MSRLRLEGKGKEALTSATRTANVKQVLTIILAVLIFNLTLNPTNLFGISLTLAGGACESSHLGGFPPRGALTIGHVGYARVELLEKSRASALNSAQTLLPTRPPDQEKM